MKSNFKNKNAFTLVELLAVIVILAIITTIASVVVTGQLKRAKKGSFIDRCYQYIKAADFHEVSENAQNPYMYLFPENNDLSVKQKPDAGYIYRNEDHQYKLRIWDNKLKMCAAKGFDQDEITINDNLDTKAKCVALDDIDVPLDESQLADNQYQIAYYINYPESMLKVVVVAERDSNVKIKPATQVEPYKRAIGWTTKSDGTGTFYASNENVVNPTDKKTLSLYPMEVSFNPSETCHTNYINISSDDNICRDNLNPVTSSGIVCKRATILHGEQCNRTGSTYCAMLHTNYITYGNCGSQGTLNYGDAFTCDVNGDGEFDEYNERFYYINRYFDTNTRSFDNSTAVLLYYNNVSQGTACNRTNVNQGVSYSLNPYAPAEASKHLPTTSQWPNVSLKTTSRNILNSNLNITSDSPFDYNGYAARLVTHREIGPACGFGNSPINTSKLLTECLYIWENTNFTTSSIQLNGYFLENFETSNMVYTTDAQNVRFSRTNYQDRSGVRPAIEVPIEKIAY